MNLKTKRLCLIQFAITVIYLFTDVEKNKGFQKTYIHYIRYYHNLSTLLKNIVKKNFYKELASFIISLDYKQA